MIPPRIAVIGAGHLGRIHARLLGKSPEWHLQFIADPDASAVKALADELGIDGLCDYQPRLAEVDAVVIAAPTTLHAEIGLDCLRQGCHVLMEKPLATTVADAEQLVDVARGQDLTLQVGHVERFNPAWTACRDQIVAPAHLHIQRHTPYSFRSTDVGVVLDLMVHDLDLVLSVCGTDVLRVSALGQSFIGAHEDYAHARLEFRSGCVADLTASRVSHYPQRSWHIMSPRGLAYLDFAAHRAEWVACPDSQPLTTTTVSPFAKGLEINSPRACTFESLMPLERLASASINAIQAEHQEFLKSIRGAAMPTVDGTTGLQVVSLAERVLDSIRKRTADFPTLVAPPGRRRAG